MIRFFLHFGEISIDDRRRAIAISRRSGRKSALHLERAASRQRLQDAACKDIPYSRYKECEPDAVGQKSRCQQEQARGQQANAGKQFAHRDFAAIEAILNPRQCLKALMTKQGSAKYSGQDNHPNRRPQAKSLAGFDEDGNFGDRHANENEEKDDGHACSLWVEVLSNRGPGVP